MAFKRYPLIDISRSFVAQENFMVNSRPLLTTLNQIVDSEATGTVSVYYEFLNSGANIQINKDARFYPASLIKIPVALAVMKKVERGEWSLNQKLILADEDRDSAFGTLYNDPPGTPLSIKELLKAMLIDSDNTADRVFIRNLSPQELGEIQDALGLQDLFDSQYQISAKEYTRLFRALYYSSFLERDESQQVLQWLTQTPFSTFLEAGIPSDVLFAHKIGEDAVGQNYLDSGIVYLPNRAYMLTVMVKNHDESSAQAIMKSISQAAYNYTKNYQQSSTSVPQ